jgi:uncharacterized protein (DUF2141 family)
LDRPEKAGNRAMPSMTNANRLRIIERACLHRFPPAPDLPFPAMPSIAPQESRSMPLRSATAGGRPPRPLRISYGFGAVLLAAAAAFMATPALAQDAPAGCTGPAGSTWIQVVVDGMRNASGDLAITLYPDVPSRFLAHHGSLYVGRVKAVAGTTTGCIFVPRPGVYVIAIDHDENANGKFDRSGIGLPDEGYGFSNNPTTLFGLPSFRSVRLNITRPGLSAHIHIKYP